MRTILFITFLLFSAVTSAQSGWSINLQLPTQTETIRVMSSPSDSVCWFITNFDRQYKTIDGGQTWNSIEGAIGGLPASLYAVDENMAFISFSFTSSLFRTIDGGNTWDLVYSGNGTPVVRMRDQAYGVMASRGLLYKTYDGGLTWDTSSVSQPPYSIPNSNGKGTLYHESDQLWVGQYQKGVSYSPDFGSTWITPDNSGFDWFTTSPKISFANPLFGIALENSSSHFIYVTTDGGQHWIKSDDSMGANEDVVADGDDLWYIPNPADHFYLKHSGDHGQTWQNQLELEDGHGFQTLEKARTGHRLWAGTEEGRLYRYDPMLTASPQSEKSQPLTIYPNPADQRIFFSPSSAPATIDVLTISGDKVISKSDFSYHEYPYLDVSFLPAGIYAVCVHTSTGVETASLIIAH